MLTKYIRGLVNFREVILSNTNQVHPWTSPFHRSRRALADGGGCGSVLVSLSPIYRPASLRHTYPCVPRVRHATCVTY